MDSQRPYDIIAIGGSAGSFPVLMQIFESVPVNFCVPVVVILHRMKNVPSEMDRILSVNKSIREPDDKEPVADCRIYLAPQNYHLLVEEDRTFSLDYSEPVHYSRPSIDVSFLNIADTYKERCVGILLSGANRDGAAGIDRIVSAGGVGIVQDPATAEYSMMPRAAVELNNNVRLMNPDEIAKYINSIIV